MNDSTMNRFVNVMKNIANKTNQPDTMIFGEVKELDPIKIDIGNNIILTEEFLFLGQMCRPHKVKIPHTHEYNGKTEYAKASGAPGMVVTTTGQATTTVVETQGHKHDIKDQVTEDVHKSGSDYEKSVTIEIEPKLKVGDKVLMFAFNNYQMYYVAERIERED